MVLILKGFYSQNNKKSHFSVVKNYNVSFFKCSNKDKGKKNKKLQ